MGAKPSRYVWQRWMMTPTNDRKLTSGFQAKSRGYDMALVSSHIPNGSPKLLEVAA
jgi:hypothetical protein